MAETNRRPHTRRLRQSALAIGAAPRCPDAAAAAAATTANAAATAGGGRQSAFVFIKPHANTPSVRALVEAHLQGAGITVAESGSFSGPEIASNGWIDRHYYSIASKATLLQPAELNVPADAFEEAFGESWAAVLSEGRAYNALGACVALGVGATELNERWEVAMAADERVKLGGGFYCAKLVGQGQEGQDIYTFNAFFMTLREAFTAPDATISWYNVEFDSAELSWKRFRGLVIGPTDPTRPDTPPESLRGKIAAHWQQLGLSEPLDGANNGVHASASPLEGYAERANWLGVTPQEDGAFGRRLLELGVSEDTLASWVQDPSVPVPGPGDDDGSATAASSSSSLFDLLEDLDLEPCLEVCRRVADSAIAWDGTTF